MFCEKCGNKIPDDGCFCIKCGAKNEKNLQAPQGIQSVQDGYAVKPMDKSKRNIVISIVLGLAVLLIASVFLYTSFFSKPTFIGKNSGGLIRAAQMYVDSEAFQTDDYTYDYEITNFIGKMNNYYQFSIIGTIINNETGEKTTYTEEDGMLMVLTETEEGIEVVPTNKWKKYFNGIKDSAYKSNAFNIMSDNIMYDYATGELIAYVRLHNGYNLTQTVTEIEITIFEEDGSIIAKRKENINLPINSNSYYDKRFIFHGDETYKFVDDLSGAKFDISVTLK